MHSAKIDQYINKSSLIKRYAIKKLLNSYDLIIVISEYWKDVLAQYTNNRIIVVFNPITLSEYIPTRAKHERFTVLTLGELGERKGTESIIKIASLLRNEEILFEIGGNGDLPFYNKLAVEAGVEKSVIFKGWVDGKEKDALLDNSHVYFLPSLFEGLPMSIIEAMAKSLPIIATKVGGIPEIVIDSRNGFTHEPADVEGMSISILKLKRDADLRKNLGAYSYKIVKSRLEKEVIAKEIDNIYSKFLECSILK
jgi:glycosyltransferase involved in cell wall biosynthesis